MIFEISCKLNIVLQPYLFSSAFVCLLLITLYFRTCRFVCLFVDSRNHIVDYYCVVYRFCLFVLRCVSVYLFVVSDVSMRLGHRDTNRECVAHNRFAASTRETQHFRQSYHLITRSRLAEIRWILVFTVVSELRSPAFECVEIHRISFFVQPQWNSSDRAILSFPIYG